MTAETEEFLELKIRNFHAENLEKLLTKHTHEEEMRDRIAELERLNRDLQMENDLLKKVRELEMKDRYL